MNLTVSRPKPSYDDVCKKEAKQVTKAFAATATTLAGLLRKQGRADTKSAGKFGAWAFAVRTKKDGPVRYVRSYAGSKIVEQLEFGAVLKGRPLLYIRLSHVTDAPRNPRKYTGELAHATSRKGTPLLVQVGGSPKYFGTPQVTMPRKLHLRDIGRDLLNQTPDIYSDKLSQQG